MGLETVNHISDLNVANPLSGDNVSQGDDHIRNIKKALLTDFPNINAAVAATPTQLDYTTVTTLGTAEAAKALTVSLASTMTFNGMTIADLGTVTTADINGGTVDGVAIGNSSRSSIKATTLDANQSLVLATGATVTGIDDDANMAADSASLLPTQAAAKGYTDTEVAAHVAAASLHPSAVGTQAASGGAASGFNVSSGSEAADLYTVTFTSAMASATKYSVVCTVDGGNAQRVVNLVTQSTGSFTYNVRNNNNNTSTDFSKVFFQVFEWA